MFQVVISLAWRSGHCKEFKLDMRSASKFCWTKGLNSRTKLMQSLNELSPLDHKRKIGTRGTFDWVVSLRPQSENSDPMMPSSCLPLTTDWNYCGFGYDWVVSLWPQAKRFFAWHPFLASFFNEKKLSCGETCFNSVFPTLVIVSIQQLFNREKRIKSKQNGQTMAHHVWWDEQRFIFRLSMKYEIGITPSSKNMFVSPQAKYTNWQCISSSRR